MSRCRAAASLSVLIALASACSSSTHALPFSTNGKYFTAYDPADGVYRPFFIKGTNLGVGLPGTHPGELAIDRDSYQRWFGRMKALGLNAMRVYTLHHPRFYEELFEYNEAHPQDPLWIFHGIWLDEENPSATHDLDAHTDSWRQEIRNVIDATHGNARLAPRFGKAYGVYAANISNYIIGWIAGREIFPEEVSETNSNHPQWTRYEGRYLDLPSGTPTEVWSARQLDYIVGYERENYEVTRPVTMSSWPTLDPLTHPTEPKFAYGEDAQSLNLASIDMFDAPGGFFVNFHAYPYYPNFVSEQPSYRAFVDDVGPNSYLGYVTDLADHYPVPVLIGEFGVPTSWGNAHFGHSGMNHGGHTEVEQGQNDGRLLRNLYESGCAGGLQFAWFDEWWKRTWITDEIDLPIEHRRLWPNYTAPEQNFGLIAWQLDPPKLEQAAMSGDTSRITKVERGSDAGMFYVRIHLGSALTAAEKLTVGFDTYDDALGESILPDGTKTRHRNEFALVYVHGEPTAQLHVTEAYDLKGIWHAASTPKQLFHSIASDGAPWNRVTWMNDDAHHSDDFAFQYPASFDEIGRLRVRARGSDGTSLDAVLLGEKSIELRLPWTLLQVMDPTSGVVIHDDRRTAEREGVKTDGIHLSLVLGGKLSETTTRYDWPSWTEQPRYVEREKKSLELYGKAVRALPHFLPR